MYFFINGSDVCDRYKMTHAEINACFNAWVSEENTLLDFQKHVLIRNVVLGVQTETTGVSVKILISKHVQLFKKRDLVSRQHVKRRSAQRHSLHVSVFFSCCVVRTYKTRNNFDGRTCILNWVVFSSRVCHISLFYVRGTTLSYMSALPQII